MNQSHVPETATCEKLQQGPKKVIRFAAYLQKIASMVALNESGREIGEGHPRAKLSDRDVELMRTLHEAFPVGHPEHVGYRRLAAKFECSREQCRDICNYKFRAQTAARHKRRGG